MILMRDWNLQWNSSRIPEMVSFQEVFMTKETEVRLLEENS